MPKVAVLPKLSHPNRRWWRSASATLYAAKKIHTQNHRATCPVALESLNLFWRWSGKGSSFKSSAGKPQASTRHLWCNTLDKTTQHWIKHTVEFVDWQDLGTKNLMPNTCKSGEAALLKLQNCLPNVCCVTGLENNTQRKQSLHHNEPPWDRKQAKWGKTAWSCFCSTKSASKFLAPILSTRSSSWAIVHLINVPNGTSAFLCSPSQMPSGRSKASARFGTMPPTFFWAMSSAALPASML